MPYTDEELDAAWARSQQRARKSRFATERGQAVAVRVPKEEKKQKGRFARLAGAIPDPIKDIAKGAGKVFTEVDKPLSNRLGVNLPGPADMVLEEFTRPTNLLVAAGGAGVAPRTSEKMPPT